MMAMHYSNELESVTVKGLCVMIVETATCVGL
jgi:hypothetical protein